MDRSSSTRAAHYDRMSAWYDRLAGPSERRFRDLALSLLQVRPGERVLELGSGTGHALAALGQQVGPTGLAWGIDLSAKMCRITSDRLEAEKATRAAILRGDATCLPFPNGACDAIYASFALELFPAEVLPVLLQECRRVLRGGDQPGGILAEGTAPAGRLAMAALLRPERETAMTRLYAWAGRRFPEWVDCRPLAGAELLSAAGFRPLATWEGALWGLPVQVVVASN